jgi:predicted ester cyclase
MALTHEQMDAIMDRHFRYEMEDDVDGVLTTLADDAIHDIVGAPDGPTHGPDRTRATYEQLFSDLAGEHIETRYRAYGHDSMVDESVWSGRAVGAPLGFPGNDRTLSFRILHVMEFTDDGLIQRENVWLDYPAIAAQLQTP